MPSRSHPIRTARPEDAASISNVHQASREALYRGRVPDELVDALTDRERLARWKEWLADPGVTTLVGEDEDRIVGFCTLRAGADGDLDHPRVAEIPTLYMLPDLWGRGWGTALCAQIEQEANRLGFHTLVLWVMEMNHAARTFYAHRGFAWDGAERTDTAPEPTALKALRYRKRLT